ncbi:MAG: N-acetylmuramoyl-L-alanine amidase [Pseudonocardiales bacterium]|jgi:hypothetical protein|nr:N-acetylmuramoyl-L-alanine amidase [Pseudonocardiales bacterium]
MGAAVGAKGIDSAKRVDSNLAKEKGAVFQVRYSAGAATDVNHSSHNRNKHKLLQQGELQAILRAGLDFIANDEWYEDRKFTGAAGAEQDAPVVLAYWRANGLAPGSTIMLNHDTGQVAADLGAVDAYYDRYNQILAGEYMADGFYGPKAVARHLVQGGRIKHYWIPEAASFYEAKAAIDPNYAPPAKTNWDLWAPTPSQVKPAIAYFQRTLADILPALQSVVWQDFNKWFEGAADENIVIKGDRFGSHLDNGRAAPPVEQSRPPGPPLHGNPVRGMAVPAAIAKGSGRYLGSIDGPANSIGGANASEQRIVKLWQQFLIWGNFVHGHSHIDDGWADGIFDTRGGGVGNGPSSQATARFQHAHMPGTTYYGQVWWDDWTKAASM